MEALNIEDNHSKIFSSGQSEGKSGSFFFFSYDFKFVIKTISFEEKQILSNLLKDLTDHFI